MASTILFSPDESFNFEILRALSATRYSGADVGEVLRAAALTEPGNFESFYEAFNDLALRVSGQAQSIDAAKHPVSARDAYYRASAYFRSAEFYLHGDAKDPRIAELYDQSVVHFDKANALLPNPGKRLLLKADGFDVSATYYRAVPADATPRRTLIVGTGFDGGQEELFHAFALAALERGYNVMTYEGPGQGNVRRQQGVGFIHDWERAVSPVVDYVVAQAEVDSTRVALLGWSLGGYLSVRAAAFEPRLAAVLAVDGVYSFFPAIYGALPPHVQTAYDDGEATQVNDFFKDALASGKAGTSLRWSVENGLWCFNASSPADLLKKTELMTLEGITDRVRCPVLVCEAADDMFFQGQPALVSKALGDRATHVVFTSEDGAGYHCHMGAMSFANHRMFDWLDDVLSR